MNFYKLVEPEPGSYEDLDGGIDILEEDGTNFGPAPTCPRCGQPLGTVTWLPPYRVEIQSWGAHWGDISQTLNDVVVSERLKEAFERSGLKGLESFEPVEVVKVYHHVHRIKEPMPRYYKASVVRSATTVDQAASGYEWEDPFQICAESLWDKMLKRYRRNVVKQETWNGDDIFFPRGGTALLVSDRFRLMFLQHGLRGAVFVPSESEQAGFDSRPWETETK